MNGTPNRRNYDTRMLAIEQRIDEQQTLLELHERREENELSELMRKINEIHADSRTTAELVQAWNNAKGFMATGNTIAKISAIITGIISPFVAIWIFFKTGYWNWHIK